MFFRKLTSIVLLMSLCSCGKLIFREIVCREHTLTLEKYMFSDSLTQSIKFMNLSSNQILSFQLVDKAIDITEKYYSDTGCSCKNISGVLATSGRDSIWISQTTNYIEKQPTKEVHNLAWFNNGNKSFFNESHKKKDSTITLNNKFYDDVIIYTKDETVPNKVQTLVLKKGLGILYVENKSGEKWINLKVTNKEPTLKDFVVNKVVCN